MVSKKVLDDFNDLAPSEEGTGINVMSGLLVVADRLERIAEAIKEHTERTLVVRRQRTTDAITKRGNDG